MMGHIPDLPALTKKEQALIEASEAIRDTIPEEIAFLHATLCQVHFPRSRTDERSFTRTDGTTSLCLHAGDLWDGRQWNPQPMPYGVKPRLVLFHLNGHALRYKTRAVPVARSLSGFLRILGLPTNGGKTGTYRPFREQVNALSAARMQLGWRGASGAVHTATAQPIEHFEAWSHATNGQRALWPGIMHLSQTYYDTLCELSVPLDPRAIGALAGASLDLDIYTWLAHRLHRLPKSGQPIHWRGLRGQFGPDYKNPRDFKRAFLASLRRVLAVYPTAKVDVQPGLVMLRPSPPPVPKTKVVIPLP